MTPHGDLTGDGDLGRVRIQQFLCCLHCVHDALGPRHPAACRTPGPRAHQSRVPVRVPTTGSAPRYAVRAGAISAQLHYQAPEHYLSISTPPQPAITTSPAAPLPTRRARAAAPAGPAGTGRCGERERSGQGLPIEVEGCPLTFSVGNPPTERATPCAGGVPADRRRPVRARRGQITHTSGRRAGYPLECSGWGGGRHAAGNQPPAPLVFERVSYCGKGFVTIVVNARGSSV